MKQEVQTANGWAEFIPSPRWVRAKAGEIIVADSKQMMLLRETGSLPIYHFPKEAVRQDLLMPSGQTKPSATKGKMVYHHLQLNGRLIERAAWHYEEPPEDGLDLTGYIAFRWEAIDEWYEEADQIYRHARDPYKRIDVALSSRHIQVVIGGEVVADSRRARLLFETGLPTRYYIPKDDIRTDLLRPSDTKTQCPYKGISSYYAVEVNGQRFDDIAWYYPFPVPECPKIENLVCFFNERVDAVIVDGVVEDKVPTPWSVKMEDAAEKTAAKIYIPDHRHDVLPSPRHVRAQFGGVWVGDSKATILGRERGYWLREYCFPQADVRLDLLEPSDKTAVSRTFGPVTYYHLRVGDRLAENAVRLIADPPKTMRDVKQHMIFDWHQMDAWFEEDEQVYVHARDPFSRVDVLPSSRHVQVHIDGELVADTQRAALLFETGLPTRYYIPKADIRMDLLRPSDNKSNCPYKGTASYYSVQIGDSVRENIAWYYPFPIPECPRIENLVCFYNEVVDIMLDGELAQRPKTHFI